MTLPESDGREIRDPDIAMIFQDPMTSLNPGLTVEEHGAAALMPPVDEREGEPLISTRAGRPAAPESAVPQPAASAADGA